MQITLDTNYLSALDVDVIKLLAEKASASSPAEAVVEPRPATAAPAPKAEEPVEEEPKAAPAKRTRRAPAKKAEEPKAEEPKAEEPKAEEPKAEEAPAPVEEEPEEPKESKADLQAAIDLAKEFMGKLGKPEAVKLALATVGAKRVSELKGDAIGAFVEELNNAR